MMEIYKYPEAETWELLLQRPAPRNKNAGQEVRSILSYVKTNGDKALLELTERFDGVKLSSLAVPAGEMSAASAETPGKLKSAIDTAYRNILKFHEAQKDAETRIETTEGVVCWRKPVPIDNIGLYIPGGSAPLFSTVLMLGIPAQIAGCEGVFLCSPPRPDGSIHPAILYAAGLTGIKTIFRCGGAQAIAAMGYGTESVPRASKIFGPGNSYVTAAKTLLSSEGVAIDMPAGPSEVAVLADETCIPEFVAADLLSQAEHGPDSQVVLVSDSESIIERVSAEVQRQLKLLPRKAVAEQALMNSKAILVRDLRGGIDMLNVYAPEHLILCCADPEQVAGLVRNAGSVFLGNYTPESAGDYASGTNHTLPTGGFAKVMAGVSLDSFVKKITFQQITRKGLENIGTSIMAMAEAEGLEAHSNAVSIRLNHTL